MGSLTDFKKKYGIPVYEKEEAPAASRTEKPDSLKKFMKRHGAIDYQERARQKQMELVDSINKKSAPFVKTPQTPSEKSFDAIGKALGNANWAQQKAVHDQRLALFAEGQKAQEEAEGLTAQIQDAKEQAGKDRQSFYGPATTYGGQGQVAPQKEPVHLGQRAPEIYQGSEADKTVEQLEARQKDLKLKYWSSLFLDPKFGEKSAYVPGSGNLDYQLVNRVPSAVNAQGEFDQKLRAVGLDKDYYGELKDDEVALYNYLYSTQGADSAKEFLEAMRPTLYARQRTRMEDTMRVGAEEAPVASSILSVAMSPMKGIGYLGQTVDYLADGTIDQNAPWNRYSHASSTIREQVGSTMGGVGNFLYQTGMSMGDFVASLAASGGNQTLSLILMGTGSASDTVIQAKDRGLSDDQAFALGTVAGAAEVAMERIGMDKLFDLGFLKDRGALAYILRQAFSEGGEEIGTELINTLADLVISQDQNLLRQQMEAYVANGMTESQAFGKVMGEKALDIGLSGLGGFLSGGFMGSIGAVASKQTGNSSPTPPTAPSAPPLGELSAQPTEGVSPPSTNAEGSPPAVPSPTTPLDPATLMDETIAQLRGAPADPIAAALDTIRSGGTVSNRQASDILANANAVQQLVQQTGMTLPDTASGKRAAVKDALATLAARQPTDLAPLSHVIARSDSDVAIPPATAAPLAPPLGELSPQATEGVSPTSTNAEGSPQPSAAPPNDAVFLRSASDEGSPPTNAVFLSEAKDSPQPSATSLGSPSGGAGTANAVTEGVTPPSTSAEGVSTTSTSAKEAPPVGASSARPTQATPSSVDGGDFPTSPLESSFGPNTVGSAQSAFEYKEKTSGLYENTYENATSKDVQAIGSEAQSRDPRIGLYAVETEAESLFRAKQRTATEEDIDWEYDDLMDRDNWNGEDNDTAMRVLDHLRKSGDLLRFDELAAKQRELTTSSAQMTQSFAKYTRQTTTATAVEAMGKVNELSEHDIQKRAYKKQGFDQWQQDLKQTILDLANQIDGVTTGDVVSMREVIRALAQFRRTTAWMGCSSKLTKIADSALGTLDFETLKAVANAQFSMIPEDFRRRSVGQIVRTIRIHNMLSSLATFNRNAIGNVGGGLVDGFSDSTVGRGLDVLVSLATGKRTVGNDIIHGKTYLSAATQAAKMAAMCVELDIPMDSESRFSVGYTRTHSPQRGIIGRFLSAYEKGMRHALEVSDQFFEGGSAGAVRKSLEDLGAKSGLTDDEISAVAGKVGKRRTYKDDRKLTRGAKLIKRGLDEFGSDELGLGDLVMPFTGTSSNLGQTAVDYSGAGVFTGLYEIMKLIRDVRRGDYEGGSKTTTHRGQSRTVTLVEAQRQAVTNAARGITGAGLVAAFAAMALTGIIRVHDDEDKDARALDQSQDLSGAQFNVDAMLRAFNGEDTAWQAGDHTVTIDFLEPFNAQMYIGYILSQEETVADMLKAYPGASLEGIVRSILDMPMMQGLSETADLISGIGRSLEEGDEVSDWGSVASDVAGQLLGSTGTSFIPAWLRQSAYMADPYYRDTTGDDPMEKAINQIKSNIPGLSTTLPMKYSGLGEEQRRHEGGISGFFNTFVNPGKISTIDISNIAAAVDRISEATGNVAIYPEDKAPASFTYDGTTVTISGKEMTETYQRTYGESVATLYDELIASEDFQSLPAADQASVLEKAKTYATHLARASVSDYNKVPAYIAEKGKGVSEASAILRHHVASIISDAFTSLTTAWKNGTSADASVSKLNEAYDTLEALPTKTRAAITKELTGRQAAFVEAKKAGLTTESFTDLYRQYRDIEATSKTASQKAQDWSHALELSRSKGQISTKQRDILKDKLYFAAFIPQDASKYDSMVTAGIPAKEADYVTDLLAGLLPEDGYTNVRQIQQMEAIVSDRSLTSYTDDLLHVLLDDKADEKYDRSRALGLEADEYVQLYRHYLDDRKKASFLTFCKNELSLSTSTAETLYKIWSGKA